MKEGCGPCTCHQAHLKHLSPVKNEVGRWGKPGPRPGRNPRCASALFWLRNDIENIDCHRFLLEARATLSDPPEGFNNVYDNYWAVYGTLLLELISRAGASCPDIEVEGIWGEIRERFTSTDEWGARDHIIKCFLSLANEQYAGVSRVGSAHFEPFWEALDRFTAYFLATFDIPNVLLDTALLTATRTYYELFYSLTWKMVKEPGIPDLHKEVVKRLTEAARAALLLVVGADMLADGLSKWRDAVSALCAYKPSRKDRPPEVQVILDDVANELHKHSRAEKRAQHRATYKRVLAGVIPLLRCYERASARKRFSPSGQSCSVKLTGSNGEIAAGGFLINVCDKRYRGFCVETKEVYVVGECQDGGQLTGETVDGEFRCREVEVCRAGDEVANSFKVREVTLEFEHDVSGERRKLVMTCKILRAWRFETGDGTGFAVLAPKDAELPVGWKEYVDNLPFEGRYQL